MAAAASMAPAWGPRQQRQEGEQRDHRQVLEQQHPEGGAGRPGLAAGPFLQVLQHDGGGRQRQDQPDGQGATRQSGPTAGRRRPSPAALADASGPPPKPKIEVRISHSRAGADLQPDQEQQDHHAELGEAHHVALLAHQSRAAKGPTSTPAMR